MNDKLTQAIEAQKAAEQALEQAKAVTRNAALEKYREAVDACRAAGIQPPAERRAQWQANARRGRGLAAKATE